MAERNVKVTLSVDGLDAYKYAIAEATNATRKLADARREAGIEPRMAKHIEIVGEGESTRVLVDGLDITYWISADGFSITHAPNSLPTVHLALVADRVTRR